MLDPESETGSERRADMNASSQPISVVALMGISYCGSTLLNFMLDSHPAIAGGGEVHSLINFFGNGYSRQCSFCRDNPCPTWQKDRVEALKAEGFYGDLADIMGTRVIVDSSKTPKWFEASTKFAANRPTEFYPVVIVKHPIRHLCSLLVNSIRAKIKDPKVWDAFLHDRAARRQAIGEVTNNRLIQEYNQIFNAVTRAFGSRKPLLVHYEGLVLDPNRELTPLLSDLGLGYDPVMESCFERPHHQIGGNSGTNFQYHRDESRIKSPGGIVESFYTNLKGISMDNKYQAFFTEQEMAWLHDDPIVQAICSKFGYQGL